MENRIPLRTYFDSLLQRVELQIQDYEDNAGDPLTLCRQCVDYLQEALGEYSRYEGMVPGIAKEVKTLFPQTTGVSLSVAAEATADTSVVKRYVMAAVSVAPHKTLGTADRTKLAEWLEDRLGVDTLRMVVSEE